MQILSVYTYTCRRARACFECNFKKRDHGSSTFICTCTFIFMVFEMISVPSDIQFYL